MACDTDNNKLHNEKKTSQPTKDQRYDRLMEENISNIMEGKNPWVETSGRLITPTI